MYDISFLKRARELCSEYDVLLIFDEVATGFGRTGYRFVADEVLPDILVLGKALTGGYIGHAVTVANQKVFDAFYSDDDRKALMHGPTFMGNPLACAVALKGIEIFEREDYMSKIHRITEISHREMDGFTDPRIREVRIMGGCTCVDVYDPSTLEGFQQFAYERGVFSRPFLTCMYTMMPYIIKEDELSSDLRRYERMVPEVIPGTIFNSLFCCFPVQDGLVSQLFQLFPALVPHAITFFLIIRLMAISHTAVIDTNHIESSLFCRLRCIKSILINCCL